MAGRLAGKVAVVGGAGSIDHGLSNGAATSILFAREGAKVVAADADLDRARATAKLIWDEGNDCLPIKADMTIEEEVEAMTASAVEAYGRIDILFNNVGLQALGGPLDVDLDHWDRVMRINVTSMLLAIRAVLPRMIAGGGGSIINNSSIAGIRSAYPCLPYATSKGAVNQLTQHVGILHAKEGIRCNAVLPGLIDTPRVKKRLHEVHGPQIDHLLAERAAQVPNGRLGDAWDVAYAVLYLASDEAKYVNATTLIVDGGMSAK